MERERGREGVSLERWGRERWENRRERVKRDRQEERGETDRKSEKEIGDSV